MPRVAAPTGADVQQLFVGAGVIPNGDPGFLDFDGAAAAAIAQWETDTRWYPFVSTGIVSTRQFRLNTTERIIDLKGGLLSDPSTVTVTIAPIYGGSAPSALQHQTQWELLPFDELAARGKPYTMVEILRSRVGIYAVTGIWGRSIQWPDDAWEAVRRQAALVVAGEIELLATGTPNKMTLGPVQASYDANALEALTSLCESRYRRTLDQYIRLSMM